MEISCFYAGYFHSALSNSSSYLVVYSDVLLSSLLDYNFHSDTLFQYALAPQELTVKKLLKIIDELPKIKNMANLLREDQAFFCLCAFFRQISSTNDLNWYGLAFGYLENDEGESAFLKGTNPKLFKLAQHIGNMENDMDMVEKYQKIKNMQSKYKRTGHRQIYKEIVEQFYPEHANKNNILTFVEEIEQNKKEFYEELERILKIKVTKYLSMIGLSDEGHIQKYTGKIILSATSSEQGCVA